MRLHLAPACVLPVHWLAVAFGVDDTGSILNCWVFSTGLNALLTEDGLQTEQAVNPLDCATSNVISFLEFLRW